MVYIAIDGCAPAAKMVQQRQRRFLAAASTHTSGTHTQTFNSNCISPGTDFMSRMCEYIKHSILKHISKTRIRFVFSSANVPGEGEHKIMQYVRDHKDIHNLRNCIYGPDGDLIMLVLASPSSNFSILRDDLDAPNTFVVIDMKLVRSQLFRELRVCRTTDVSCIRLIHDFITMGFLVGNDFLPKIQMFYYLEDGMTAMIDTYIREFSAKNRYITHDGEIILSELKRFVRCISMREEEMIASQVARNFDKYTERKFIDSVIVRSVTDQRLDFKRYAKLYNDRLCENVCGDVSTVDKITNEYVRGLYWTFMYYTDRCPSYEWYYPYYRAPLMIDLADVTFVESRFVKGKPHEPYQQLLGILPAKSRKLIPKELRHLMTDEDSPISHMYPSSFEIDYEGKYKEHQGIPLLPPIHYFSLRRVYEDAVSDDVRGQKNNKESRCFSYRYSETAEPRKIRTIFGTIDCAKFTIEIAT